MALTQMHLGVFAHLVRCMRNLYKVGTGMDFQRSLNETRLARTAAATCAMIIERNRLPQSSLQYRFFSCCYCNVIAGIVLE